MQHYNDLQIGPCGPVNNTVYESLFFTAMAKKTHCIEIGFKRKLILASRAGGKMGVASE